MPDRDRIEEIRDGQLHDSQKEEPRTVLLYSQNGEHPRQGNQKRQHIAQENPASGDPVF
jgi:hypothetical protein